VSSIDIRPARPSDAAALSELGTVTFVEKFGHLYRPQDLESFLTTKQSEAWYKDQLTKQDEVTLIMWDGDEAIGYALAGPLGFKLPIEAQRPGEIARFYIRGTHQSRGLGAKLMEDTLAWLDARFDDLFLSVFSENLGAQKFYERYGFGKIGEHHFMVGEQADLDFIFARIR